ncbi:MAG: energy-coupling factor transporter transmembrane protein EcfT [Christensenellaceae bacterium]|jgi:energy-coupling factor transport system permease protein|nr:energy-coupling factor transporter transmembrane protein EcfT [Christensenellaceae bacterium]
MKDFAFGQYYPAKSPIHSLDPRVKILLTIAYAVAVFLSGSFIAYLPALAFLILTVAFSKIPLLKVLKSVKAILFLVLFTSVLNIFFNSSGNALLEWKFIKITDGGLIFAGMLSCRLILLVTGTSLLTFTTNPVAITDGIESLMYPLKLIKVPVHDIALTMSIALRFIPILSEEVQKIMLAQKARGADFDTGSIFKRAKAMLPVLIPLFISAFRRADELAIAMDARCYGATEKRTRYKELKIKYGDIISLFLGAALVAGVVLLNLFVHIV